MMTPTHDSIRGWFASELYNAMLEDDRICLLTGDLGFLMLDRIRDEFPDRFVNVGASEQLLIGAAVGLALEGKIPFCYSITTFLLYRPFEWIRNFIVEENIPVRLVGSGFNDDYAHDGITHQPFELKRVLALFPEITPYFPQTKEEVPGMVSDMISNDEPSFICLRR